MYIKTKLLTALLLLSASFLFAQKPIDYIPADATLVMSMNPNHLDKKISLEQLSKFSFFQDMLKSMSGSMNPDEMELVQAALESPSEYGMDFMTDSYFVMDASDEGSFFSYIFKISDASKAGSFFKKQQYQSEDYFGDTTEVKLFQGDGFEYLDMGDAGKLAWNKNIGVLVSGDVDYEYEEYSPEEFETSDSLNNVAIVDYMNNVMSGALQNNIQTNPRFIADTRASDMHLWIDNAYLQRLGAEDIPEEMAEYGLDMFYEQMTGMYEGTYSSMSMNFDKGAMNMDMKTYMNPELAEMWSGAMAGKMNKKLHKYIKGDNLLGLMAANYSVENSVEATKKMLYKSMEDIPFVGGMANSAMDIMGIFIDDEAIYNLLKGDMVFAMTGMREFEKEIVSYEYDDDFNRTESKQMSKETLPEFTMLMSYGNKDDMMKFVRLGEQFGTLQSKGKYYQIISEELPMDMYLALQDGILFFTNDTDLVTRRLSSGFPKKQRISKAQCKMLKNSAATFFWDIPETLDIAEGMAGSMGFSGTQIINLSKNTFENITMTMDKNIINNTSTGKMNFNFTNKDQNSLEQFFNFINDIYITEMGGRSM